MVGSRAGLAALRVALAAQDIRLGALIGSGAAATVYEGHDEKHGRRVAIKVLDPLTDPAVTGERFAREIGVVAGLRHPHIMPLYNSGEAEDLRYYIMPFATGESLKDRLMRDGPLPLDQAIRLGVEMIDALGYAHGVGVVHRDVKPGNILIEGDHFVLADFGIAAVAPAHHPLTAHGSLIGTLEYMAPEQMLGEAVDGRADLFALASVLYEALSGRLPFAATNPTELARLKLLGPHDPLDQAAPHVPPGLAAVIDHALAADPDRRIGSAAEFQAALRELPESVPRPIERPRQLRRAGGLGPASLVVVTLGALALWWFVTSPTLDPRRVVVAGFTNETGHPALDAFGDQIESWISDSLSHLGQIEVITAAVDLPIRRLWTSSEPATQQERLATLAKETRAGTVVTGSFFQTGNRLEVSAEVTDARTGELRWAIGPVAASPGGKDQLAATVGREVVRAVDSLVAQSRPPSSTDKSRSPSASKSPPR